MNIVKRSALSGIPISTYQVACTAFLCVAIPQDFFDLGAAAQEQFLNTHAWEPLDLYSAETLWKLIDSHAYTIHHHCTRFNSNKLASNG